MNALQANKYIGLPWEITGEGPFRWNCWNLLRHIQLKYFRKRMPYICVTDAKECREVYAEQMRAGHWVISPVPEHGDGVLLKDGRDPHVGVYLDIDGGGVLHAMEGYGVIFTPLRNLKALGFGAITFYRIHNV